MNFDEVQPLTGYGLAAMRLRSKRVQRLLWPESPKDGSSRLGRILVAVGVLLALMILAGAVAIIQDRRATAYAAGERESASLAVALAEQTSRTLRAAFLDLNDVVETIQSKSVSSQAELAAATGTEAAHRLLRAGISALSQVSAIAVVGTDGRMIGSSQFWPALKIDLSDSLFFRALQDNPSLDQFVSPPVVAVGRGTWTIFVVRRINAPDGRFIGMVTGAIELAYFDELYRAVAEGNGLGVSLWRYDGTLLARYPFKADEIGGSLHDQKIFATDDAAANIARSFAVNSGNDRHDAIATRAVEAFQLFVTVSRTEASIAQEWRGQAIAIGTGSLLTAALLTLAMASLVRQIARREASEKMLRQHRDNLEREVAARTKALAASEARHRDVAEVAGDWLWEHDAERRFTFASDRFGEATGIPIAEFIGKRIEELPGFKIAGSDREKVWAAMTDHRSFSGLTSQVEYDDGRVRFWRTSAKPYFDSETGAFAGYRGSGTDVTDAVENQLMLQTTLSRAALAEESARRARAKLLDAIEILPAGFALWDADDRLELCNVRYREIYGRSAEIMVPGLRFEELLRDGAKRGEFTIPADQDIDRWIAERVELHRSQTGSFFEHRLADGRWIQVDERRTSGGGVVGTRVDVTEVHKREASENERAKLAALGQLAGGVAHEINNLLQPAIIFPELLAERLPESDVESREDLASILDGARKARDIVKNILRFARKEELALEPLDLVAEVTAALSFVRDLIPPTVSIVQSKLEPGTHRTVSANKTQLTQVVTNLVVNAAQAMQDRGTITLAVAEWYPTTPDASRLEIEVGRPYLAVSVTDTGPGMDETTQSHIFEPFFTTKAIGQGTGLGLSVVYGILRSWNGAIAVASKPGEGATFTLYIPTSASTN